MHTDALSIGASLHFQHHKPLKTSEGVAQIVTRVGSSGVKETPLLGGPEGEGGAKGSVGDSSTTQELEEPPSVGPRSVKSELMRLGAGAGCSRSSVVRSHVSWG